MQQLASSKSRQALLVIFVVSGFTGLIYESIWSHYLKLFLGHAAYAQTLVLAIFMGGMALGSWIVSRYCARIRQLLLGYVIVEGVIGVFGLVFHRMFVGATDWTFEAVLPGLSSGAAIYAFKWTLAALLILPQSALLGMTFPLISGGIIRRWPQRPGEILSMLYFTNSLGAAVGVLASGFLLIRLVGLPGTILTAGLLNILLALVVWAIVKHTSEPELIPEPPQAAETRERTHLWFLLAAFFTGAASFLYEIGWIRMLSLVLGSSSHSFELMLSAFIFGLAFGGLWMRRRIDRINDPARYLAFVMLAMATCAVLTLPAYNLTFDFMAWSLNALARTDGGYTAFNFVGQAIAVLIMVPTTFCAGMTLPLLTSALLRTSSGERAIGAVYAANTLGAIVGVLLAVHVLMPYVGTKGVVLGGALVHVALGASGLILIARASPQLRTAFAVMGVVLVAGAAMYAELDPMRMTSAVYRTGVASRLPDSRVTYLRDGKTATISVTETNGEVAIATNGKPDAVLNMGSGPVSADEITMVFAAALPISMHPNPRRVANIGFGSGLTSHAVLGSTEVERLDSIEIEPFMVEAARQAYGTRIEGVFRDPRSHIFYEDAKTFFATRHEPYDVIISEPSNPWVSGVATLFSHEFYQRVVTHLAPDGYFVQWLQLYETDINIIASVMKALTKTFSDYAIYTTDQSNLLIVATRGALQPASAKIFASPALRAELERVGIRSLRDIQQRRIGERRTVDALFASYAAPPNSDYFPFVDLNAPRLRFVQGHAIELPNLILLPVPVVEILGGVSRDGGEAPPANSRFPRDEITRDAWLIRNGLVEGGTNGLAPAVIRDMLLIRASAQSCREPPVRDAWRRAVREVSDRTTTFLSAADLEALWTRIRGTPCYADFAGIHRDWADFLAALAARDLPAIETSGMALLAGAGAMTNEERALVTMGVAAAQIAGGRHGAARELLEDGFEKLQAADQMYALPLRQLLVLSRQAGSSALARADGAR